jgi:hypothetical protein
MVASNFPQEVRKFEIETYAMPKRLKELKKTHVPFSGSPLNHPYDPRKVILVPEPYGNSPSYYEFKSDDITYAEKLPSIVNLKGETVTRVRFWVKKMALGVLCTPFRVEVD